MESIDLRRVVQRIYSEKRAKNPSYSLRAFSRHLGIHSSALSEILSGKRKPSAKLVSRISDRLVLPPEERARVISAALSGKQRRATKENLVYDTVDLDNYHSIAEWWHFGILSLVKTQGFKNKPEYIAKRLGISKRDARTAVQRLLRVGLLEEKNGTLVRTKERVQTSDQIRNPSLQHVHIETLGLVERSIRNDSLLYRDNLGLTMAISPEKLPHAKKIARRFLDQISRCLETERPTEVYKLCVHLFPLTRSK